MCGIVGVFGQPDGKNIKMFTDMLQMDVVRGWDSTGALTVKDNDYWFSLKDVGLPQKLITDPEFKKHFTSALIDDKHKLLLGHNRAATKGGVTVDNAHPFRHGHIILVHNGTLISKYALEKDYEGTFGTDSEAITWSIHHRGVAETWKILDGAAVLVWWDDQSNRLNFLSNGRRTFCYGYTEGREQMIFASEAWMIHAACARHKVKLEKNKVFKLDDHHHWEFRMSRRGKVVGDVKKLDPFVPPKVTYGASSNYAWKDEGPDFADAWREHFKTDPEPRNAAERMARASNQAVGSPWLRNTIAVVNDKGQAQLDLNSTTNESGSVAGERDFTELDWDMLRKKTMDEITFHQIYEKCHFCGGSLEHEYEESVILDDRSACCDNCQTIAELENLNLAVMR